MGAGHTLWMAGGASGTAECLAVAECGIVTGDFFFATWAGADSQLGHCVSPFHVRLMPFEFSPHLHVVNQRDTLNLIED